MRRSSDRVRAAAQATLTPGERITASGVGWAAARRDGTPLLFQARRQYWVVLTDRRMLVFGRRRGGPDAHDLALGKRYDFFTLDAVKRVRPLLQVRVTGANGNRQVLEFRPGQRRLGAELVARLQSDDATEPPAGPADRVANATTAAFWGER